jgi:2-oxoglutarate dehydrogenase E2 component (dihydrolipoamide succinyltransferase)
MVMSKRTSPHVTTVMEADLSAIIAHRKKYKDDFEKEGLRLTFTAYFVSATVAALKAFPLVNSSWSDESIILHPQLNVGMATDLGDEGLIVPVIKDADQLSLRGIARAVNDLAERARAKKLTADEVQDGTFTITNHGVSGSLFAAPIINQPQCAILGVGAIQKRVIVITDTAGNDSMAIRPMAYLSLTFDHRILDGAIADHFLAKLIEALEEWPGA